MPIYKCNIRGSEKPLIVKADTAAKARAHCVGVSTMTAEEMFEAVEHGATVEKAIINDPDE